jgi:serine/threonine protein kinase
VVRRFLREVQATAQLSHPNVIHAYDADAVNDTLFLVMEFVEGTDLAKLVKKQGPLPVAQACRYISQAARGLEHAYQRGLIHRDIKPHNLLLSREGFVKVLDLGLVRLREAAREPGCSMTGSDCVMGTPDYIAPEQARDSHAADTRADLYSLGCTLYFLLSGRVPFPGGSLTEKLLRHNLDEPTPVEKLRPEVPAAVAAMVAKLMAKKPGDRYQTPTEAVAALTALENDLSLPPPVSVPLAIPVNVQGNDEDLDLLDALSREARDARATMDTVKIAPRVDPKKHGRRRRWFLAGIAGLAMLAITAFHLALRGQAQPVDSAQTPRRPLAADRQNRPGPTHRHARPHTIPAPAPHSVHSRVPGPASDPSSR